jgi:hypothetical protein
MENMFQGMLIFGIAGIVLIYAALAATNKRREYESTVAPEDRLTDEQFRKIEYGDDL